MKKIIAFAGSNSKTSINKKLATFTAGQIEETEVKVLDLNDYVLPLYGIDLENEHGIPDNAQEFFKELRSANGIVLSMAEHNGAYATVLKNLIDWMSRIDSKLFGNIPMLLMATSPGGRGGASVLELGKSRFPYLGGNIVADFSLPSFGQNFSDTDGILNSEYKEKLETAIQLFKDSL